MYIVPESLLDAMEEAADTYGPDVANALLNGVLGAGAAKLGVRSARPFRTISGDLDRAITLGGGLFGAGAGGTARLRHGYEPYGDKKMDPWELRLEL